MLSAANSLVEADAEAHSSARHATRIHLSAPRPALRGTTPSSATNHNSPPSTPTPPKKNKKKGHSYILFIPQHYESLRIATINPFKLVSLWGSFPLANASTLNTPTVLHVQTLLHAWDKLQTATRHKKTCVCGTNQKSLSNKRNVRRNNNCFLSCHNNLYVCVAPNTTCPSPQQPLCVCGTKHYLLLATTTSMCVWHQTLPAPRHNNLYVCVAPATLFLATTKASMCGTATFFPTTVNLPPPLAS